MKKEERFDGDPGTSPDAAQGWKEAYTPPKLTHYGNLEVVTGAQQAEEYKVKLVIGSSGIVQSPES
jgi:hypothetical protein